MIITQIPIKAGKAFLNTHVKVQISTQTIILRVDLSLFQIWPYDYSTGLVPKINRRTKEIP